MGVTACNDLEGTGDKGYVTQDGLIRLGSRVFSAAEGIPPHELANGEFGPLPIQPSPTSSSGSSS